VKSIHALDRLGDDEAEALWTTVAGLKRKCEGLQEKLAVGCPVLLHRARGGFTGGRAFGVPARGQRGLGLGTWLPWCAPRRARPVVCRP
jgi:hypothetical protein